MSAPRRLTYAAGPNRAVDCPLCSQAARVDRHGDRLAVRCYAGCDSEAVLAALHVRGEVEPVLQDLLQDLAGESRAAGSTLKVVAAGDVVIEPVNFVIEQRVARRAATILAGDPGLGKSTLAALWAAQVTAAGRGRVLVANAEDARGVTAARLRASGADMERVFFFSVEDEHGDRAVVLPDDVPLIEAKAQEIGGVDLIVVDPLNAHLADSVSSHRDHSIRRAIAPCAAMVERLDCALVFVAHLNKGLGGDALYRVGGSIGLVGGVRSVLLFTRDPDDPEGDAGGRRCLGHIKSNWGRKAPTLLLEHVPVVLDVDGQKIETHRLDEIGETTLPGEQLLGVDADDPPATKRDRAIELLADTLAGAGWVRASEIEAAARAQDISRRTLYSAADEVGVGREKRGFPAVTWWHLGSRAAAPCTTAMQEGPHDCAEPIPEPNGGAAEPSRAQPPGNARQEERHLRAVSPASPYDVFGEFS